MKHNTPYDKAQVIIAYTHNTRIKYNEKMCEKLGINSMCDSGAKIICKTNDLRELNIYNNFCYEVVDGDDEFITITNGNEKYEVEKKYITKYFDFAYARTTHSVQGQTLNSFHYCIEDIDKLDGRGLYTLISRLKQEPLCKCDICDKLTSHSGYYKVNNQEGEGPICKKCFEKYKDLEEYN